MPAANSSSAIFGVMPRPPAEFSPLTTTKSGSWRSRSAGSRLRRVRRPIPPTMSPTNRMDTPRFTSSLSAYFHLYEANASTATERAGAPGRRGLARAGVGSEGGISSTRRRSPLDPAGAPPDRPARPVGAGTRGRNRAADPDRGEHRGADHQPLGPQARTRPDPTRPGDPAGLSQRLRHPRGHRRAAVEPDQHTDQPLPEERPAPGRPGQQGPGQRPELAQPPRDQHPHPAAGSDGAADAAEEPRQALGRHRRLLP